MKFFPSPFLLFAFLTIQHTVHSSSGRGNPSDRVSTAEIDFKTKDNPNVSHTFAAVLENELSKENTNAIFANNLKIDGRSAGPKYFTSKPEIVIHGDMKYFHVYSLKFFDAKIASGISLLDEESVERIKRQLVTRSIFVGRIEHILVSKVIIGDVNYGPILLPAKFE